jgi:hypothetical protein
MKKNQDNYKKSEAYVVEDNYYTSTRHSIHRILGNGTLHVMPHSPP